MSRTNTPDLETRKPRRQQPPKGPQRPACSLGDVAMKILGSPAALIGRLIAYRIALDWWLAARRRQRQEDS